MGDFEGAGAGTFGVGEDMEARNRQRFNELPRADEFLCGLASCAADKVDAYESIGYQAVYFQYFVAEKRCVVAAAHKLEHGIGTALQRYVEMRHERTRPGTILDYLVGEQVGFDR